MIDDLQKFLVNRKLLLLVNQKLSPSARSKDMIEAQIRCIESILIFLDKNKKKEVVDMTSLELSLDKEAKSIDELKPRKSNGELATAIIALANSLKPGTYKQINTAQIKPRSVATKVHVMKKKGVLPQFITVASRGKELFLVRKE